MEVIIADRLNTWLREYEDTRSLLALRVRATGIMCLLFWPVLFFDDRGCGWLTLLSLTNGTLSMLRQGQVVPMFCCQITVVRGRVTECGWQLVGFCGLPRGHKRTCQKESEVLPVFEKPILRMLAA